MINQDEFQEKFNFLISNIAETKALLGANFAHVKPDAGAFSLINKLFIEDYPIIHLQNRSDLLLHIEGSKIHSSSPLAIVRSIFDLSFDVLGKMLSAIFDVPSKSLGQGLSINYEGTAPGSLYIGLSVKAIECKSSFFPEAPAEIERMAKEATAFLADIPQFINHETINSGEVIEQIPNPVMRDAVLLAAFAMSPTEKRGYHSIDLSALGHNDVRKFGVLNGKTRDVLRNTVVKHPVIRVKKKGAFQGQLKVVDLNKNRVTLQGVEGIGRLYCFNLDMEQIKKGLNKTVVVSGLYEENQQGTPSMMMVDQVRVIEQPPLLTSEQ